MVFCRAGSAAARARRLALALLVLACAAAARAQSIYHTGLATKVTDGDTLQLTPAIAGAAAVTIRLHGIDAPESKQTCRTAAGASYACGQDAKAKLAARVSAATLTCQQKDRDRYGRVIAVCRLASGGASADVNDWMVRQGWAVAYRQYSPDYVKAEDEARLAKRGIWQGWFQWPWDFRNAASPPPPSLRPPPPSPLPRPPPPRDPKCNIKGNISSAGKIYHTPDSPYYAATQIDESKGERWFCTEAQAAAEGWRRWRN